MISEENIGRLEPVARLLWEHQHDASGEEAIGVLEHVVELRKLMLARRTYLGSD
jgi:hypothetical protein